MTHIEKDLNAEELREALTSVVKVLKKLEDMNRPQKGLLTLTLSGDVSDLRTIFSVLALCGGKLLIERFDFSSSDSNGMMNEHDSL